MTASLRLLVRASVIGLGMALCGSSCGSPATNWILTWSDEFDGAAGTLPNPDHWVFDVGTDWGNAQLEYDTNRPENVSHDGEGNLRIVAREESFLNQEYTSGRITTHQKFSQALGRFEARIKLPIGQGIWPAFWLLGSDFPTVGWPQCGEIDIMEYRGQQPGRIHASLHGPGYSGGNAITGHYDLPDGKRLSDGFHVFAVEWDANEVIWYLDDVKFQSRTSRRVPGGSEWVFDHPFFIILNVAVGGNFVGPPNATTQFPQTMLVDYVRVYRAG